jgi:hypothetical protein
LNPFFADLYNRYLNLLASYSSVVTYRCGSSAAVAITIVGKHHCSIVDAVDPGGLTQINEESIAIVITITTDFDYSDQIGTAGAPKAFFTTVTAFAGVDHLECFKLNFVGSKFTIELELVPGTETVERVERLVGTATEASGDLEVTLSTIKYYFTLLVVAVRRFVMFVDHYSTLVTGLVAAIDFWRSFDR